MTALTTALSVALASTAGKERLAPTAAPASIAMWAHRHAQIATLANLQLGTKPLTTITQMTAPIAMLASTAEQERLAPTAVPTFTARQAQQPALTAQQENTSTVARVEMSPQSVRFALPEHTLAAAHRRRARFVQLASTTRTMRLRAICTSHALRAAQVQNS